MGATANQYLRPVLLTSSSINFNWTPVLSTTSNGLSHVFFFLNVGISMTSEFPCCFFLFSQYNGGFDYGDVFHEKGFYEKGNVYIIC